MQQSDTTHNHLRNVIIDVIVKLMNVMTSWLIDSQCFHSQRSHFVHRFVFLFLVVHHKFVDEQISKIFVHPFFFLFFSYNQCLHPYLSHHLYHHHHELNVQQPLPLLQNLVFDQIQNLLKYILPDAKKRLQRWFDHHIKHNLSTHIYLGCIGQCKTNIVAVGEEKIDNIP